MFMKLKKIVIRFNENVFPRSNTFHIENIATGKSNVP
jgi:hypothetical protein